MAVYMHTLFYVFENMFHKDSQGGFTFNHLHLFTKGPECMPLSVDKLGSAWYLDNMNTMCFRYAKAAQVLALALEQ